MNDAVIEVLQSASSQDPNVLKSAEHTLKQWETQRGFYVTLFNVFSNQSFSLNVRWMAVLYLKNGVDRYWRKNAPGEIAADEKELIRQGLMTRFNEPVNQLAIQTAVVIAKIARFDCPREWGSLVPTLLEVTQESNSLSQHRALLTFHHVVKTLAAKRLGPDRQLFRELTTNIFNFILNIWNTNTEAFFILTSNGADANQIQESLGKAHLSLKILAKLIINGFTKPSQNQEAILFLKVIFERAKTSLECRRHFIGRNMPTEICDKFIIHLTKVLLGVLDYHPFCYVDLVPSSLEFIYYYCFTDEGRQVTFERFLIQCLNLLKKILLTNEYRPAKVVDESKHSLSMKVHQYKQEFFTDQILTEICTKIVTHYFVLSSEDLEFWNDDPENFGLDDCGESWKYSLRPCTESVFLAIIHQFKEVLSNILVQLIEKHHHPVDPNDINGLLLKDAVYNAVGLAGFDLYDEVNFDQWFSTTLKQELSEKSYNYRIIRRRICWLIGRWTGVKLSAELRPDLYKIMVESLSPEEDLGIRLAASDALKLAIDDFQFNANDFLPYLESSISLLFTLLKEVSECDTKMRVLYGLSIMIERVGREIYPYIGSLSSYLPELWQESEKHNMLRCAIVSTLVHLEKALGSNSVCIQPLVIRVIEISCNVNQEEHVYLLEDGLELWLVLLENAPSSTPEIVNLTKNMPALLESSTENLRLCLYILQAYVLLNPQDFLSDTGISIMNTLRSIIGDLQTEGIVMIVRLLEQCLEALPERGVLLIKPLLKKIFESVYHGNEYPLEMSMYLSIIARIILDSKPAFIECISDLAKQVNLSDKADKVLGQIIGAYVQHMPLVTEHKKRKLLALALCSLLDVNIPQAILQYFPQIISNIVEVLNDISKYSETGSPVDSLLITSPAQLEDVGYENEHLYRKRRLSLTDPVHCYSLKDVLQNQMDELKKIIGMEHFEYLMNNLNADISQQLREYIII